MRSLSLVAGLLLVPLALAPISLASAALAQEKAQRELNALTGAPDGTRCFLSIALAQDMAKHYIASGMCPRQLAPVDPADFMNALETLKAVDEDFTSDACQVQMKLMFRAGREWIQKSPRRRCVAIAAEMRQRPFFKDYVRQ
jgi:hypothetical protein